MSLTLKPAYGILLDRLIPQSECLHSSTISQKSTKLEIINFMQTNVPFIIIMCESFMNYWHILKPLIL